MNRTFLCGAIEGLTTECGYHFQQGDKSHYPTTVCRYPSAFLSEPKFVSIEGRKHGRIAYTVSLHLANEGAKLSPSERREMLDKMENEMVNIFIELSNSERVAVVDKLTIAPATEVVDNHGAVAIIAEATITTIF